MVELLAPFEQDHQPARARIQHHQTHAHPTCKAALVTHNRHHRASPLSFNERKMR